MHGSIRQTRWIVVIVLPLIMLALVVASASALMIVPEASSNYQDGGDLQRLLADTGGAVDISMNSATGVASFVRLPAGKELDLAGSPAAEGAQGDPAPALTPEDSAEAFFNLYGGIFGVSDFSEELALVDRTTDAVGHIHLTYRQVYQGQEVFAGQLRVHFNQAGRITSVNGTFIPNLALDTTPILSLESAEMEAANFVAELTLV